MLVVLFWWLLLLLSLYFYGFIILYVYIYLYICWFVCPISNFQHSFPHWPHHEAGTLARFPPACGVRNWEGGRSGRWTTAGLMWCKHAENMKKQTWICNYDMIKYMLVHWWCWLVIDRGFNHSCSGDYWQLTIPYGERLPKQLYMYSYWKRWLGGNHFLSHEPTPQTGITSWWRPEERWSRKYHNVFLMAALWLKFQIFPLLSIISDTFSSTHPAICREAAPGSGRFRAAGAALSEVGPLQRHLRGERLKWLLVVLDIHRLSIGCPYMFNCSTQVENGWDIIHILSIY